VEITQISEKIYVAGASLNDFTVPDEVADDGSTDFFTADLIVEVNGVEQTSGYTIAAGVCTFDSDRTAGDVIRIYRESGITTPKVDFPSASKLNADTHLNKNTYHLLWLIQEVWTAVYSCLRWVYSSAHEALVFDLDGKPITGGTTPVEDSDLVIKSYADAVATAAEVAAKAYADALNTAMTTYVNNLFSSLSAAGAFNVTIYPTTVSDGDTYIDIAAAYGTFTTGLVIVGGVTYNIATDITISDNGGNMRLTFDEGAIVGDHNVLIVAGTT